MGSRISGIDRAVLLRQIRYLVVYEAKHSRFMATVAASTRPLQLLPLRVLRSRWRYSLSASHCWRAAVVIERLSYAAPVRSRQHPSNFLVAMAVA